METIADNDGILWLNKKHMEGLNNKNLQEQQNITHAIENIDMNQQMNQKISSVDFLQTKNLQSK